MIEGLSNVRISSESFQLVYHLARAQERGTLGEPEPVEWDSHDWQLPPLSPAAEEDLEAFTSQELRAESGVAQRYERLYPPKKVTHRK